jgi:hypothetical protein
MGTYIEHQNLFLMLEAIHQFGQSQRCLPQSPRYHPLLLSSLIDDPRINNGRKGAYERPLPDAAPFTEMLQAERERRFYTVESIFHMRSLRKEIRAATGTRADRGRRRWGGSDIAGCQSWLDTGPLSDELFRNMMRPGIPSWEVPGLIRPMATMV